MNTGLTFLQLSTLSCPLWGHLLHVLDSCPWSVLMLCDITNDWERLVQMVFLKVQTLSLDCLLATRCWRGKAAVLMILTRPEIGLFILGCLPRNRLVAVKALTRCVSAAFLWYINTVRMTPEPCFFLLLIEKFQDWKQFFCSRSSVCSKASEVGFSTEVTGTGLKLNYLF